MPETPAEIQEHIRADLTDIGSNLQELETKVKKAFDWRSYFDRHTAMLLSLAFGGGMMAAALIGGRRSRRYRSQRYR